MTNYSSGGAQALKQALNEQTTKGDKMTLRSYKMTHDTGFAPNVSGDTLSLATCKPKIREVCKKAEWIAGFNSKTLDGTEVGKEKLVYLAKVSKAMTFAEFWDKFEFKRPDKDENGDNIYKPKGDGYEQDSRTMHHTDEKNKKRDLSVDRVLLCDEFYYFSVDNVLDLGNLRSKINVPKGQSAFGNKTIEEDDEILETNDKGVVSQLIDFVRANKEKCAKFKDDKGKVGGSKGVAANSSAGGSCGSAASKASSCGCGTSHTSGKC